VALSRMQRATLLLRYLEGFSLREIATLLDSTPGAVGVHLYRARARLRTLLEEPDDADT